MPWIWDELTKRYRDTSTGRFLSFDNLIDQANQDIDDITREIEDLARAIARGDITVNRWHDSMANRIKQLYIDQVILGAGGRGRVTPELWDEVIGRIWAQYEFLNKFAAQIAEGRLTEGQILRRSRMYGNSSRSAFWLARDAAARKKGMVEERWISQGDTDVCFVCSHAGAEGWKPIGTYAQPGSGTVHLNPVDECLGLTSCRCLKEYR